jgi:phosphoglycerate dehydrogenase-like enzyme
MRVVAWDRGTPPHEVDEFGVKRLPMDELLSQADVVSIHLRLSDESRGLIDREKLSKMKPGAILINTSRGAIIDEPALVAALQEKRLAALDSMYSLRNRFRRRVLLERSPMYC